MSILGTSVPKIKVGLKFDSRKGVVGPWLNLNHLVDLENYMVDHIW
jgi:hypothetical protein